MVSMLKFPNESISPLVDSTQKFWNIIIRDMKVDCLIGIHDYEKAKRQPVSISICCNAIMQTPKEGGENGDYLCYDYLIQSIRELAEKDHIHLVETLAERIADFCLKDERVQSVNVIIEKTAVYGHVGSVGVEITRRRG